MFRKFTLAATALAMGAATFVPVSAADAQRRWRNDGYSQRYYDGRGYDRRDWRGRGRCNGGDTGLLVGAVAGGLLGRTIDTRGDRTLGTLLGAGAGALAGRAIERGDQPRRCR